MAKGNNYNDDIGIDQMRRFIFITFSFWIWFDL